MMRRLPLLALPLLLAACATPTQPTVSSQLQTLYDYQLSSEGAADLTLEQAIARIADADIILVGELHSHPAVHLLQSRLLSGLYTAGQQHGRPLALSMEQFSRADQKTLDAYLANQIGEAALIREGNAWPNYPSDYRPLVEFDGGVWRLHEITVNEYGFGDSSYLAPRDAYFGEPPRATIRLIAEPSR